MMRYSLLHMIMCQAIIGFAQSQDCLIDLVFVVDSSGSIRLFNVGDVDNWQLILDFMAHVVDDLDVDTGSVRVGLVTFSRKARVEFTLGDYTSKADVKDRINSTEYVPGGTNTTGGLRLVRTELLKAEAGDRDNAPNIIILITDGTPTVEVEFLYDEAKRIKLLGSRIIIVRVAADHEWFNDEDREMHLREMQAIVSEPHFLNLFVVDDFKQLAIMVDGIAANQCSFDNIKHAEIKSCVTAISVIFILDLSGFHTSDNYDIVQDLVANLANDYVHDFIKSLVRQLTERSAEVSVAAVSLTGEMLLPLEVRRDFGRLDLDLDLSKQELCEQKSDVNITTALTQASGLLAGSGRDKKAVILIADQQLGDVDTSQMEDSFNLTTIGVGCKGPRGPLLPPSDHHHVLAYTRLGETTSSIVEKLCQD